MAVGVVELLEAVDVQHDQAVAPVGPARGNLQLAHQLGQGAPVAQAGELVAVGHALSEAEDPQHHPVQIEDHQKPGQHGQGQLHPEHQAHRVPGAGGLPGQVGLLVAVVVVQVHVILLENGVELFGDAGQALTAVGPFAGHDLVQVFLIEGVGLAYALGALGHHLSFRAGGQGVGVDPQLVQGYLGHGAVVLVGLLVGMVVAVVKIALRVQEHGVDGRVEVVRRLQVAGKFHQLDHVGVELVHGQPVEAIGNQEHHHQHSHRHLEAHLFYRHGLVPSVGRRFRHRPGRPPGAGGGPSPSSILDRAVAQRQGDKPL